MHLGPMKRDRRGKTSKVIQMCIIRKQRDQMTNKGSRAGQREGQTISIMTKGLIAVTQTSGPADAGFLEQEGLSEITSFFQFSEGKTKE